MVSSRYEISRSDIVERAVDVLVLGGGIAGVFAAAAAKTPDNTVVIVEPTNILGGQGTTGGVAGICGDTARVNSIFVEFVRDLDALAKIEPFRPNDDRQAYDLESCGFILQELVLRRGVEVWLHSTALDAKAERSSVQEVLVLCGPTLVRVRPKIVIDATGNALVATMVGLETHHLGALQQLPMSLYFTLWDTGRPVYPYLPPGCPQWQSDDELPMTSLHSFADGRVEVKMKVVGFDAADGLSLSDAEIFARRQMMGLIYHLQTKGYKGKHGANAGRPLATYTLASVSRAIGQREGRRIVGEKTLTEHEVRTAAEFDDAVAVGTYHLDFHWPDIAQRAGTGITDMVEPYHIPLGAMVPKGLDNVLCPGRSLSGDQMAMSSYRVMATCAQMGYGAGKAAEQSVRTRQDLGKLDLAELRANIEKGGQSLDLSHYGEYLRCLQQITQEIDFAGQRPAHRFNRFDATFGLYRGRNGRTYGLLYSAQSNDILISLRHRAEWSPVGKIDLPPGTVSVELCTTGSARIAVSTVAEEAETTVFEIELPDSGGGNHTWRSGAATQPSNAGGPERSVVLAFPSALTGAEHRKLVVLQIDDAGTVLFIERDAREPATSESDWRRVNQFFDYPLQGNIRITLCHVARAGEPDRFDLIAIASLDGGASWCWYLMIAREVSPSTVPALIYTPIGFAVAYMLADGSAWYWEGAIERLAPVGSPPPTEADLKALPYKDRVLLASPANPAHAA